MKNTIRELQLCELQILKDVRIICDRHGIKYYLSSGTLLGAVRHKGFIPWDDDVDIMMPYEDYQRFLEVAQQELGEQYFVQNSETDPSYSFAYTHIRKNNTAILREWDLKLRSHHGVWIDVFPMVRVKDGKDRRRKNSLLKVCLFLIMDNEWLQTNEPWLIERSSKNVVRLIKIARKLPLSIRVWIRGRILRRIIHEKRGEYVSFIWSRLSVPVPAEAYEGEPVFLPFEDDSYPAPRGYEQFLTRSYGDYMTPPPVEKRSGGHGEYIVIDLEHDWTTYFENDPQTVLQQIKNDPVL